MIDFHLVLIGVITGFFSGFFGIGGGTVLIPMLIYYGFDMKSSVSISVMQMVFTSVYGSFLNLKRYLDRFKDGLFIGVGGVLGSFNSSLIVSFIDEVHLRYFFIFILFVSMIIVVFVDITKENTTTKHSKYILIVIGFFIGMIAMSIGVGGSVMLTPILLTFMGYDLKSASALGLFFVIFSSVSGSIGLFLRDLLLYNEGLIVGIGALIGVYIGIKTKNIITMKNYKIFIIIMYIVIILYMVINIY